MRHQKNKVTLDRKTAARRSLLANLCESLILHEKIVTTTAKAKALRPRIEKMVTSARRGTLAARRELGTVLYTENAIRKMMEVIAPRYKERAGGYTRIIKVGTRKGDNAEESVIEFVQ